MWYSRSKFCVQNAPDNELNLLPNVREIIPDLSHFKLMKFVFLFWDFKALESKPLNPAADKHTPPLSCCAVTLQLNLDPVSELLFLGRSGVSQSQFGASRILNSSVCSPYLQDCHIFAQTTSYIFPPPWVWSPLRRSRTPGSGRWSLLPSGQTGQQSLPALRYTLVKENPVTASFILFILSVHHLSWEWGYQLGRSPWPEAWSCPPACYRRRCPPRCPYRSALCQRHSDC